MSSQKVKKNKPKSSTKRAKNNAKKAVPIKSRSTKILNAYTPEDIRELRMKNAWKKEDFELWSELSLESGFEEDGNNYHMIMQTRGEILIKGTGTLTREDKKKIEQEVKRDFERNPLKLIKESEKLYKSSKKKDIYKLKMILKQMAKTFGIEYHCKNDGNWDDGAQWLASRIQLELGMRGKNRDGKIGPRTMASYFAYRKILDYGLKLGHGLDIPAVREALGMEDPVARKAYQKVLQVLLSKDNNLEDILEVAQNVERFGNNYELITALVDPNFRAISKTINKIVKAGVDPMKIKIEMPKKKGLPKIKMPKMINLTPIPVESKKKRKRRQP